MLRLTIILGVWGTAGHSRASQCRGAPVLTLLLCPLESLLKYLLGHLRSPLEYFLGYFVMSLIMP